MYNIESVFDDILNNSISDCNDYKEKVYSDCVRCLNCAGLDDRGEMICCKEIEKAEE